MPSFITLTLRPSARDLPDQIKFLKSCFRRLRATKPWKDAVDYGMAVIEVTRGSKGDHWHVHLHAIAWMKWIDKDWLHKAWKRITYGSFHTHIEKARLAGAVNNYLSNYITKPPCDEVFNSVDLLREWYRAVSSQHWVIRFGKRSLWPKLEKPRVYHDWERVCPLSELLPFIQDGEWRAAAEAFHTRAKYGKYAEVIEHVIDTT